MNNKIFAFVIISLLLVACEDSSNKNSVEADSYNVRQQKELFDVALFPECENTLQSSVVDEIFSSQSKSTDTVCFYKDFPIKDTICCYGEVGTWLERNENGVYVNVSGDYGVGLDYDTLFAAVDSSSIHRCMATVGDERYKAVQIGSQTWLSENVLGALMSYDKAKEVCSGSYRLPTSADIEILLHSVGAIVETSYTKDVCGKIPGAIRYFDVPLFLNSQDSLKNNNAYGFSFQTDGGMYDKNLQGTNLVYSDEKTCFFLQSDENTDFRKAFCYEVSEKATVVTNVQKNAELYVRCIMK